MADLIIRGMEMPPEGEYHMTLYVCNDGYAYFDVDTFQVDEDRFEAVPLPKGHGRLIDAEAYMDYMQNRYDNNEITNGDWIDFRLSLKDQLAIVPAEGGTDNGF